MGCDKDTDAVAGTTGAVPSTEIAGSGWVCCGSAITVPSPLSQSGSGWLPPATL